MTCIDAGVFYGVKLGKLSTTRFLQHALIILYKQEKNIDLTKSEKEILKKLESIHSTISEQESSATSSSSALGKRRHIEDDECESDDQDDEDDEEEEPISDYQLLSQANNYLGFTVETGQGNTWNGDGFNCLVVLKPLNADICISFNPQDLLDMEGNVTQKTRENIVAYLKLIGHKPTVLVFVSKCWLTTYTVFICQTI